jgi:hypothetical protein
MIEQNLAVPFATRVLGVEVTVVGVEIDDDGGLKVVCKHGSERQRIVSPICRFPRRRRPAPNGSRPTGAGCAARGTGPRRTNRRGGQLSKGNRTTLRNREDSRPCVAAQDRGPSQIYLLERVVGHGIIGARRTHSAHLRRPWHATLRQNTMQRRRALVSAWSFAFPRPAGVSQVSNGGGHYSADRLVRFDVRCSR